MEENKLFQFANGKCINVLVRKTNRKRTSSIQIREGKVRLLIPKRTTLKEINTLIKARERWIEEKINAFKKTTN